jgi:hypothetical protein
LNFLGNKNKKKYDGRYLFSVDVRLINLVDVCSELTNTLASAGSIEIIIKYILKIYQRRPAFLRIVGVHRLERLKQHNFRRSSLSIRRLKQKETIKNNNHKDRREKPSKIGSYFSSFYRRLSSVRAGPTRITRGDSRGV